VSAAIDSAESFASDAAVRAGDFHCVWLLERRQPIERVKYIVWSLFLFLLIGVGIGWAMYPSRGERTRFRG